MRYLCAWQHYNKEDNIVKKVKMFETKTNNIINGQAQLLVKLSTEYDLPVEFIERQFDESNLIGVFYIRPKRDNNPMELSDVDVDAELEKYDRLNDEYYNT